MTSERFVYQKGDIQLKRTQCEFCKNHNKVKSSNDDKEEELIVCEHYPDGVPYEIMKAIKRCPYVEIV